ncbi:DUF6512 family protein [Anaerosacchariphilus polymeriproducens]|uniref:Uncharacterized protein n=1 Tax=Anaerosacchariphilus polymeriproducens TaxID=1812858 RepID=A0A371AWN9_9FIRM|nr:DUF6512 family protein [Anaerosacchariphilus polymeriproducens]RDU23890.1 hypothetical protein DWV06_06225 [Anaerosacchariphilus polymeriproducens]
MNSKLKYYQIIGIIFTIIFGTLLHFAYEWSDFHPFVALFSPVNESVWEHLKLLLIPFLLFSIFEYFVLGNEYPNLLMSNAVSLLIGLLSIIVLFYTYTGILGRNYLFLDIFIFIFSVILTYGLGYQFTIQGMFSKFLPETGLALIFFLLSIFILFTFSPPKLNLFLDPVTDTYGVFQIRSNK